MSCCGESSPVEYDIKPPVSSNKIVFLGDSGVGKTSCIERYINGKHNLVSATVGLAFHDLVLEYKGQELRCQLWDTAGMEKYAGIVDLQSRNASVGVICMACNDKASKANLSKWIKIFYEKGNDRTPIIIGVLKSDLMSEKEELLKSLSLLYPIYPIMVCSSVTGEGVNELFEKIAYSIAMGC